MDSRLFYILFQHSLSSVVWDRHGANEYVLVGDGDSIDHARLQALAERLFGGSGELVVCHPASRREIWEVPLAEVSRFIAQGLKPLGTFTVSDRSARIFLQVHGIGVARTGRTKRLRQPDQIHRAR